MKVDLSADDLLRLKNTLSMFGFHGTLKEQVPQKKLLKKIDTLGKKVESKKETADLWLCGKYVDERQWQFQGVFTSKQQAIKQCKKRNYFIAPVFLDESIPDRKLGWPDLEYPLCKAETNQKGKALYIPNV